MLPLLGIDTTINLGTVLIAAGMLIIPGTARWLMHRLETKLNQGEVLAAEYRKDLKNELAESRKEIQSELADYQASTTSTLSRLETLASRTNETVQGHALAIAMLQGKVFGGQVEHPSQWSDVMREPNRPNG